MGWIWHRVVWGVGLALLSVEAQALPFISFDVRANGMGGAGVAAGQGGSAIFANPALLALSQPQRDAALAGVYRFSDPRNLQGEIDNYQSGGLESRFASALVAYKADSATSTPRTNLATATQNIITQLDRFSTRPIEEEVSLGLAVRLPDRQMALVVGQQSVGGAALIAVAEERARFAALIEDGLNNAEKQPDDQVFNVIVSGPGRNLQAQLHSRGALIREVGVAMVRAVEWRGQKFDLGVTPKYVDVTTFDSVQPLINAAYNSQAGREHYPSYNVDLGVVAERDGGWRGGLAVKNLISHRYPTVLGGGAVRIQPQARIGIAYGGDWFAAALDLDLNKGKAEGLGVDRQYLDVGAELSLTSSARLRGGYRYNISDTRANMVTMGVGFGLFGAVADLGMSMNEDGLGFSGQLSRRF